MNALIRATEAIELMNVSRAKFYQLQASGVIVPVSFGPRCKRYDRADIAAVIDKLKRPAAPQ